MKSLFKTGFIVFITALLLSSCAGDPAPQRDPYNDADSQRSRAKQAQDELDRDIRNK